MPNIPSLPAQFLALNVFRTRDSTAQGAAYQASITWDRVSWQTALGDTPDEALAALLAPVPALEVPPCPC